MPDWHAQLSLDVVYLQDLEITDVDANTKQRIKRPLQAAAKHIDSYITRSCDGCNHAAECGGVAIMVQPDVLSSGPCTRVGGNQGGVTSDL